MNFAFFAFALILSMLLLHPLYLAISVCSAAGYYIFLTRMRGVRILAGLLVLFVLLSMVNPLFNTDGAHVLLRLLGRPYTWEALCYGMAVAAMFIAAMLWFMCYNRVMTSDRFTHLFGDMIPALSLLLVMVFRLIPDYMRRARQISGARKCVGRGGSAIANRKEKLRDGLTILSTMTGWALESSVVTADSMRSRGYGTAKRTCFQITLFQARDWLILICMLLLGSGSVCALLQGAAQATFTPELTIANVAGPHRIGGAICYALFLSIPLYLNLWEDFSWRISRSRI